MPKILFLRVKGELHASLAALAEGQKRTINAVAVEILNDGLAAMASSPTDEPAAGPPPSDDGAADDVFTAAPLPRNRRKQKGKRR